MTPIARFEKSPTATKDYHIDFGAYLRPEESLTGVTFAVSPSGITVGSGAYDPVIDADGKGCTFWLVGGTAGSQYTVTCHFTTDNSPPRIDDRGILIVVEGDPSGEGVEEGEEFTFSTLANSYVPRRFYLRPDIDPTGVVDATAAINAAASVRDGACIYLPDGVVRIDGSIVPTKAGVTIMGAEGRGLRRGHRVDVPVTCAGTLIHARGTTNPLFVSADECSWRNLEIYYPDQNPDGVTPTTYQPTFDVSHFGCTVENVTAINPYTLLDVAVGGFTADRLIGFPLFRGIVLGICPDVVRLSNIHLNPNVSSSNPTYRAIGPNLLAYAVANGIGFLIDGAEGFELSNCFAFGYARGLNLGGGSGYFNGGGFDQCATCVMLTGAGGSGASNLSGLVFSCSGFVPVTGGVAVHFADTHAAASASERPRCEIVGGVFDATAPGAGRGVVMPSASYGACQVTGGMFQHMANECGLNDSANAYLQFIGVGSTPTCAARVQGTAPAGQRTDINPFALP